MRQVPIFMLMKESEPKFSLSLSCISLEIDECYKHWLSQIYILLVLYSQITQNVRTVSPKNEASPTWVKSM